jgi:uncharacterized membrane protein YphA (DoxX/SURF4 family)
VTIWKSSTSRASDSHALTPSPSRPPPDPVDDAQTDAQTMESPQHASVDSRVMGTLHVACRLLVGGVFVAAGASKAFDHQAMLVAVDAYELLPAGLVGPVAAALPWIELAVGAALLAGYALRAAAGTAGVLLVGFLVALGQAKARGLAIDCGCFSAGGPGDGVSWWEIIRDIPLLVAAGWLWHRPDGPLSLDTALTHRQPTEREEHL